MRFPKASGILLHPTSLPGRFGVGDLGPEAFRFADFLAASGQGLWQVLPLTPADDGGSPYSSYSAFAGNTLLISPEKLFADGLLGAGELDEVPSLSLHQVDFAEAAKSKDALLEHAFDSFQRWAGSELRAAFEEFVERNTFWLNDYALFRALKNSHNGAAWIDWERPLALRQRDALARARHELREKIEAQKFFQFLFFKQWSSLHAFCRGRGIRIIGDIPMFVAHDSADVWVNRAQFKLDERGQRMVVAGVPPDYFSETGQFWGNPLFDWDRMRAEGFRWWIERVRATFQTVDIARIDHFRGLVACWEIPAGDTTAERGQWVETPGRELFGAIRNALGDLAIIAEDLGLITPEVEALRVDLGFPGMRVLQFAFNSDEQNIHLPNNYESNLVAYTGTHDNDTAVGWFESLSGDERKFCLDYLKSDGREIHWDMIRAVIESVADTAIIPLQDVLGLGSDARMNVPNRPDGNWAWRFQKDELTDDRADRLKRLAISSGR